MGWTIAPLKDVGARFKHGVVIVPGTRRARLDRRGAARAGSAAAASSVAGVKPTPIAELLAAAQLWAADGGCPDARVWPRRGPALENGSFNSTATRLSGQGVLVRLGMSQVRLVFPTMEEWRNPALLLRHVYPGPEYVGGKRKRGAECWYQHSLRV